jgi:predicted ribosome quality control (RQC) complex YloA/Tae2 family protein
MKIDKFNEIEIIIGKNSQENWDLIDKMSESIWLHLKSFPSCHVFINKSNPDMDTIEYAAKLCKENTKYKNLSNLKVNYTPVKNVIKAEKVGSVYFKSNRKVKSITI